MIKEGTVWWDGRAGLVVVGRLKCFALEKHEVEEAEGYSSMVRESGSTEFTEIMYHLWKDSSTTKTKGRL